MHGPFWQKVGKKDMREKWFREHIWWMSFILSLMVVWVHSENTELFLGELGRETMVYSLENFFAQTLGQIAVPGFFMISAYLFYRNFQKQFPNGRAGAKAFFFRMFCGIFFIIWATL